ncbi:hypothetical protein [Thiomicrorhabdus sp.]|uniref:hypothetical protein n=1 Tax=Thiomicrorhabdus sp. TaxID=2039724 RepID=UPI0029C88DCB|nr:hypothetical protein [Thiomicrorhabdus sp.]
MSKQPKKLPVFWIVLLGSVIIFPLMLLIQPQRDAVDEQQLPWNAAFDNNGNLHALGLVIGKSSLKEAMLLYGKDVEVKLFTDKHEGNKSLEAFFPVAYIGSIKAGLALKLQVTPEELNALYLKGKKISPTTSGGREIELYNSDIVDYMDRPIQSLTLVPRKQLTERAISMRFGEPEHKETQSDGLEHWFFPRKGLEMIIDPEGPEALQYTVK